MGGSPIGGPATIVKMLDFCSRHAIEPVVEEFPLSRVNEALSHLDNTHIYEQFYTGNITAVI